MKRGFYAENLLCGRRFYSSARLNLVNSRMNTINGMDQTQIVTFIEHTTKLPSDKQINLLNIVIAKIERMKTHEKYIRAGIIGSTVITTAVAWGDYGPTSMSILVGLFGYIFRSAIYDGHLENNMQIQDGIVNNLK